MFTSADDEEGKESVNKACRSGDPNESVRLGSQDAFTRDAFNFSNGILSMGSNDASDMEHACSDHGMKPWKDIQVAKKHRYSSEMTFEQWHCEQLAALEENVISKMTMSSSDYEKSLHALHAAIMTAETTQVADDDGNSSGSEEDDETTHTPKKRPSVREHSKAQREKRAAAIKALEVKASEYSTELTETNRIFRENLEKYAFRRKYSYETVCTFADMWIRGEQSVETWQVVLEQSIEMTIPFTTSRFRPPGQSLNGRRVLKGVSDIIADAMSLSVVCVSISNRSQVPLCKFQLRVDIPLTTFMMDEDVAMASMSIFSRNATLCGGLCEIHIDGT